jgi:ElaB/YqjD/DUF883 family membrane-anchored ribosome-binding protein
METIVKNANKNNAENTFPHADEALENAKAKGSEYWKMAKAKGQSLWNSTRSTRQQSWDRTKGFIQKHPAQAVGYAVLLGAVLTVLLYPKGQD